MEKNSAVSRKLGQDGVRSLNKVVPKKVFTFPKLTASDAREGKCTMCIYAKYYFNRGH